MVLTTNLRRARTRAGINLIELLVVVAIIAVLVSLLGVALSKMTVRQKDRSTNDQLYKLQQSVDAEYDRIVKQCDTDSQRGQIPEGIRIYAEGNPDRARSIWTALNLRRHFPDSFAEAIIPISVQDQTTGAILCTLQPLEVFRQFQSSATDPVTFVPLPNIQAPSVNEERAALLYVILAKKSASGGSAMAAGADDLSQGMQRKLMFTGIRGGTDRELQMFGDAWNNSVAFRRWYGIDPGDLPEIQAPPYVDGKLAANANKDPLDPRNLIAGWNNPDGTPNTTKRNAMATFGFRGLNRMVTVYSLGKSPTDPADDLWGHRLRQYK